MTNEEREELESDELQTCPFCGEELAAYRGAYCFTASRGEEWCCDECIQDWGLEAV